jgi:D-alanyl-lipoteichoic acid acyltransferase DltB (MBOAT superfamily)
MPTACLPTPSASSTFEAWLGVYAFSLQIYFDFSGYTDIALGSAKLLGYELPQNFNGPYAAARITEFWRRWHITLSSWLRDYPYISLGGSRTGTRWGTYRNLIITMLSAACGMAPPGTSHCGACCTVLCLRSNARWD